MATLAAVVLAVVSPSRSGSSGTEAHPKACVPQKGFGERVGIVLKVDGLVQQGRDRLRKGTVLRRNATVCTAARGGPNSGTVSFVVEPLKRTTCDVAAGSRLRLYPKSPKQVLIRFEEGRTYCATGKDKSGKQRLFEGHNGWVRLFVEDPLFSLARTGARSTVKVKLGSVKVQGRRGRPVVVGPGQQTTVPPTGPARKPVPLQETAEDKEAFGELKAAVPKPDFGPPAIGNSAVLERIFARDEIRVGLDDLSIQSGTFDFADDFFSFLGSSWRVNVESLSDGTPGLVRSLAANEIDAALAISGATAPSRRCRSSVTLTARRGTSLSSATTVSCEASATSCGPP